MTEADVHVACWPLVVISFHTGCLDEVGAHYRRIRRVLEAQTGDFVVLMDTRPMRRQDFSSERRRAASEGLSELAVFNHRLRAQAFLVADRMARGLVSGFLWITPRSYPTRVTMDPRDAGVWLQTHLPLPPAAQAAPGAAVSRAAQGAPPPYRGGFAKAPSIPG